MAKKTSKEITINSKELLQSYLITTARYDFSIYEKRIIYRIIELIQAEFNGKKLKGRIQPTLFNDKVITMPIASFLKDEEDKNYAQAKKALKSLKNKEMIYEDDKIWKPMSIIEMPKIEKYGNNVTFTIHSEIYEALLNFTKGHSKYELQTAMKFDSIYAMRLYELLYNQSQPIDYGVQKLREMFGLTEKYKYFNDFKKRVIDRAKTELDEKSPRSFDYRLIKKGRTITAIRFFPKVVKENLDELGTERKNALNQVHIKYLIDDRILDYLRHNLEFSDMEIKNNYEVFEGLTMDIFFDEVVIKAGAKLYQARNKKAYLITCLKNYKKRKDDE